MKERIKERLEKEVEVYKEQILALDSQEVFDKSYETAIKQEISSFFTDGCATCSLTKHSGNRNKLAE